jgi:hypothetical protein
MKLSIASWLEKDNIRISKENLENALLALQSIEEFRTSKTFEEAYSSIDWFGETNSQTGTPITFSCSCRRWRTSEVTFMEEC